MMTYITITNASFIDHRLPYSTKLWRISALNHIGGKNLGGLVDLHGEKANHSCENVLLTIVYLSS